jgi:hypothetical protein
MGDQIEIDPDLRVFSGVKLLISLNRNWLAGDIIEAAEYLRIW